MNEDEEFREAWRRAGTGDLAAARKMVEILRARDGVGVRPADDIIESINVLARRRELDEEDRRAIKLAASPALTNRAIVKAAQARWDSDDVNVDPGAEISPSENHSGDGFLGSWVQAWVFVYGNDAYPADPVELELRKLWRKERGEGPRRPGPRRPRQ